MMCIQAFYRSRARQVCTLLSIVAFVGSIAALTARQSAAQEGDGEIDAIKPFLNPTTIAVAQVDWQRLNLPKETQGANANSEVQSLVNWLASIRTTLSPLLDERLSIAIDVPFTYSQVPIRFIAKKPAVVELTKINEKLASYRIGPAVVQGDMLVAAPAGNLAESDKLLVSNELLPTNHAALSAAWTTVKDMPVRVLFVPPAYLWSTYEDLMPRLPDSWGGTPTTTLTEGIQWATIALDPANMRLKVVVQSKSTLAAERLATELPKLINAAAKHSALIKVQKALSAAKFDKPVVNKDRIEINASHVQDISSASSGIVRLLEVIVDPLNMRQKQENFKQLALSVHNYVDAYKVLPPNQAARRSDGTSNFSWRVHILPFIGEQKLYDEFKLNEVWHSEHNRKLLDKMPAIFASQSGPLFAPAMERGYTTIVAPVGEGTIFGGKKTVAFGHVKDGTSNTIFFVEVQRDRAVPWTAPMDYEYHPNNPAAGLAIGNDGQFLAVLADGSVQLLPGDMPKETLLHLFQMNDGQEIKLP